MYLFIRNLDANSIPELVNISFPDTLQRLWVWRRSESEACDVHTITD
jgi:hypothetical protein